MLDSRIDLGPDRVAHGDWDLIVQSTGTGLGSYGPRGLCADCTDQEDWAQILRSTGTGIGSYGPQGVGSDCLRSMGTRLGWYSRNENASLLHCYVVRDADAERDALWGERSAACHAHDAAWRALRHA
jgi:hypothetical protein